MTTTTALHPAPTSAAGLAQLADRPKAGQGPESFDPERYVGEPKLDGWRLLIEVYDTGEVDGEGNPINGVHLWTRNAKSHDGSLPAIEAEIAARFPAGTWLDSEAVALEVIDGQIHHKWNNVQKTLGSGTAKAAALSDSISLMVFDLIAHRGVDARPLPFARRRELLERIFAKGFQRLLLAPQLVPTQKGVDALIKQGFEGMMIKDRKAPYRSGKRAWTKIKATDNADCVIMGFKPGESGFTGMVGAVIFGQYKDGVLTERGRCSGMDMQTRLAMTKNPDAWIGTVIEVAYQEIMESGKLRFPQMKRRRPDKPATDCTWTEAA